MPSFPSHGRENGSGSCFRKMLVQSADWRGPGGELGACEGVSEWVTAGAAGVERRGQTRTGRDLAAD